MVLIQGYNKLDTDFYLPKWRYNKLDTDFYLPKWPLATAHVYTCDLGRKFTYEMRDRWRTGSKYLCFLHPKLFL